jgi:hypothetical protein
VPPICAGSRDVWTLNNNRKYSVKFVSGLQSVYNGAYPYERVGEQEERGKTGEGGGEDGERRRGKRRKDMGRRRKDKERRRKAKRKTEEGHGKTEEDGGRRREDGGRRSCRIGEEQDGEEH